MLQMFQYMSTTTPFLDSVKRQKKLHGEKWFGALKTEHTHTGILTILTT